MAPIGALPDPLEAYIRPIPGLTNFVFFPWIGFTFAGAVLGALIDSTTTRERETRLNVRLAAAGSVLALAAFGASYLPTPYPSSFFWTTSPAFFFLRVALMTTAVALAYAWDSRPGGEDRWSPMQQLGRTSLFIYWIHVEMVYGLISLPLHKSLTLVQACAALVVFAAFMLLCSVVKDRVVQRWRTRRAGPAQPAVVGR
jgi:fucose 4-O-acetylase-like acetyltransferase